MRAPFLGVSNSFCSSSNYNLCSLCQLMIRLLALKENKHSALHIAVLLVSYLDVIYDLSQYSAKIPLHTFYNVHWLWSNK